MLRPMTALAAVLGIATLVVFAPFMVPLVLAAWLADLFGPATRRLERALGGRGRAAGAVLALVTLGLLLPFAAVAATVGSGLGDLVQEVRAALEGQGPVVGAFLGADDGPMEIGDWAGLASRYGANAWHAVGTVARVSASVAIAAFVFLAALYTFLLDGQRVYAWLETNLPLPRAAFARLAGAFQGTGRGLLVATGGTSLAEAVLATVAYLSLGIPRALVLGPLTGVCSLVPIAGTGLVWIPVSIGLALRGDYTRAAIMAAIGTFVLGLVDNALRPFLARFGRIELPMLVVFLSMLGGLATFGPAGILFGPLLTRLGAEALSIVAEGEV
jgi:predicted PurR-regulated permease PerM